LRDRTRSIKLKVLAIARASRNKTESGPQKLQESYVSLLDATRRVVGQAGKFSQEIAQGIKRGSQKVLGKAKRQLDEMIPRLQQVLFQTRERVLNGNTRVEGKLLSVFEPETEVIRKGNANKPNEFGKLVKIQEAENQLITRYEILDQRAADSTLLIPSLEQHIQLFGHAPDALAADPGFFSAANEAAAERWA
jgi:IS5 family transposase